MRHLGGELVDFSDTAAVIANLDLVISTDTAVAHLAGAMGKPFWLLLPFVPDWRWMLQRDDSPWYPTARLFRQSHRNDWSQVIADVDAALKKQVGGLLAPISSPEAQTLPAKTQISPEAMRLFEQGCALIEEEHLPQAIKTLQQAITCHPQWAEAHFELGRACHSQGLLSQAIEAYTAAARLSPAMKAAHSNLGLAYFQNGELDKAARSYEQTIELHRELAVVFNNLGVVREEQKNADAATECYRCALRIDPDFADAYYNLGNIHLARRELDQALSCYMCAVQRSPQHHAAHGNLGRTYHLSGLLDQALACYQQALNINPESAEVHLNRAVVRLLLGQWDEGWAEYEWRFQCHDWQRTYPHRLYGERWKGESFRGRTLLVHSEQGIGDAIQFARYLPMVKARGGRVIFEVRSSLMRLFTSLQGVDELIELSADKPPAVHYHYYCPLASLPGIFNTRPNEVPNHTPYLYADPDKIAQWSKRLPPEGLNVGLVWSGNNTYAERSCTLPELAPLAFVKGINWIGLQKGGAAEQARPELLPYNFKLINWGPQFEDFYDTAAAVAALDLVISIDTAVAHLAGAMGKPVWVLLPTVPDWRWLLERSQTPWYPTAHLFRQTKKGDWTRVIAHLSASLEQWRKKEHRQR